MRGWFSDMGAVCRRGWWLIALFWGTGLIGAAQQVGRQLYREHSLHWFSPWWLLLFLAGWIAAQQLVIRDRRGGHVTEGTSNLVATVIDRFHSSQEVEVKIPAELHLLR